jgi:hypothetical protein
MKEPGPPEAHWSKTLHMWWLFSTVFIVIRASIVVKILARK